MLESNEDSVARTVTRRCFGKFSGWLIPAALGASILSVSTTADANHQSYIKRGGLTTVQVECDTLCTAGDLTGGLEGRLEWRMTFSEPTDDPDVSYIEGRNVITTDDGVIEGTDYLLWNLATGEFIDYTIFDEGTEAFENSTGYMVIIGTFDFVDGGTSNYTAVIY